MTMQARLEMRVYNLYNQISEMEEENDGSIRFVDEVRDLYRQLHEAEEALSEFGGYREANERY